MSIIKDIKNIKGSPRDLRNFGVVVGAIFLCLGLLFFYLGKSSSSVMVIVGLILLTSGFLIPRALGPFYKIWMTFGIVMGFFVTTIILTIFFYIFLTPFAFILRMFGKNFLDLRFRSNERSYWHYRSQETNTADLEKQF